MSGAIYSRVLALTFNYMWILFYSLLFYFARKNSKTKPKKISVKLCLIEEKKYIQKFHNAENRVRTKELLLSPLHMTNWQRSAWINHILIPIFFLNFDYHNYAWPPSIHYDIIKPSAGEKRRSTNYEKIKEKPIQCAVLCMENINTESNHCGDGGRVNYMSNTIHCCCCCCCIFRSPYTWCICMFERGSMRPPRCNLHTAEKRWTNLR